MKRIILFILCTFSVVSFGQDINIKNDQVVFDKVPVASFEKLGSDFKFKSLNNSNAITATWTYVKISELESKSWLTVTDNETKKKSDVSMEYLPSTSNLNMKKAIAVLLAKKYNLITVNGVENLDAFFAEVRPSFSAEMEKIEKNKEENRNELAKVNYQVFLRDKLIFSGDVPQDAFTDKYTKEENAAFMDKVVGKYNVYMKQDQSPYPVLNVDILTLNDRVLVHANDNGGRMSVVLVESKKTFVYGPSYKIDVKDPSTQGPFVKQLVNTAYLNGQKFMTLMEAKTLLSSQKTEKAAQLEEAKKNSSNIYEKEGYAIDAKGEKLEGKLSIDFEKLGTSQNGMVDLDGVGCLLNVVAKNEKGKMRVYSYKAKEGVSFGVYNEDKSETKYRALLVKLEDNSPADPTALDLGSFGLGSASWKYFIDIYSNEKMNICQDLKSKSFVIKVANKEKGFQILVKKGKEEKFFNKLKEYLGNAVTNSDLEKIDYSNVEGLKDLVDLYSKSI